MPSRSDYPRADYTHRELVTMLKLAPHVPCRSSHENGCRCPEHPYPQTTTLRVSTFVPLEPELIADPCTGGYTCTCLPCQADRARRVRGGVRASTALPIRRAA